MTRQEVYEYLCYYDPRNPFYTKPELDEEIVKPRRDNCYCESCFRGNDKLAMEILRLMS